MENENKIKTMSMYRPHDKWCMNNEKSLDECWDEFLKITEGKTPIEYNFRQLYGWSTYWKYEQSHDEWLSDLSEWKEELGKQIGDPEEYVRIQTGTSMNRAELFIESGEGYTKVENIMGKPDWDICDRWFGIQVSILGSGKRSGIDRLRYYANRQAERLGDKPVVLTGLIQRRYIYCQRNDGEFCISKKDYDKILNPQILTINQYEEKYMQKEGE